MKFLDLIRRFFEIPSRAERDAKKLNVKLDAALFHNLCLALHAEAPKGVPILVMDARLPADSADNSGWELECYAKKSTGKNVRFSPSDEAGLNIRGWLHELQDSMVRQKQPRWKGIKLTVDVPGDKYHADFKY